jgi:hypothetical protein
MPIGRIGTDFIVNSTGTSAQEDLAITALADGRFVMTWQSLDTGDGDSSCVRASLFDADGNGGGATLPAGLAVTNADCFVV